MPTSQNVTFTGSAPADTQFDHPPGAAIARLLEDALKARGWRIEGFDNWRDCGWSLDCASGDAKLLIAVAEATLPQWMLQIGPLEMPGPIGRLFGKRQSAMPADVLRLAQAVDEILKGDGRYSEFHWCWDGFPESGPSSPEPPSK